MATSESVVYIINKLWRAVKGFIKQYVTTGKLYQYLKNRFGSYSGRLSDQYAQLTKRSLKPCEQMVRWNMF